MQIICATFILIDLNLPLQVYERLQKLNVSMSHRHVCRLITKVGEDHNEKVKKWQDVLTNDLAAALLRFDNKL